jgi:hypothetical protein
MNIKVNSGDPDQTVQMCRLIWISDGRICVKARVYGHRYVLKAYTTSADPYQPAHLCSLIRISTVCFSVRNSIMNIYEYFEYKKRSVEILI